MKHQALSSSKDKSKNIQVSPAAIRIWHFKGNFITFTFYFQSIREFAHCSFQYALQKEWVLYLR